MRGSSQGGASRSPPRARSSRWSPSLSTAPGFASFRPRAQRAQAARVKSTRRRRSRREFVLCGIAFAPVVGRRGRHFGADHFQTSSVAATDSLSEAAIRGPGHPPSGAKAGRHRSNPYGGGFSGPGLATMLRAVCGAKRRSGHAEAKRRFHRRDHKRAPDCRGPHAPTSSTLALHIFQLCAHPMRARDDEGR